MDITPIISREKNIIKSYNKGNFTINNELIDGNIIILPDKLINWKISSIQDLDIIEIDSAIDQQIDILLIGYGSDYKYIPKNIIKSENYNIELMNTGAACRTYNILLSEDRKVAAALIVI